MAYDNRPNLSCQRFDQFSGDTLYLKGTNCIVGAYGTISSNTGYRISGMTFLSAGVGLNTTLIGCNASGGTAATAIGAGVKAMGTASTSIGCGSCTYGTGSISIGSESKTFCNYTAIVGCGNVSCSAGGNIFGGYGNIICSGNTNTTLIGVNNCIVEKDCYSNTVVVPDLAILTTPAGSGDVLSWNPSTKKIRLTTAITGATNGLTTDGTIVCLGGTLNGDTCINYDSGCICFTDTSGNNYASFRSDGTFICHYDGTKYSSDFRINCSCIELITENTNNTTCSTVVAESGVISLINYQNDIVRCTRFEMLGDLVSMYSLVNNSGDTGFAGIVYGHDYSANFNDCSLVNKGWVLSQISGGTSGGITGATNGLSVSGNNVTLGGALNGNTNIDLNNKTLIFSDAIVEFNSGSGFNHNVWSTAIQNDGKILVGGTFNSYSGVTANGIIRLNTNGSVDNTFNGGGGFNNEVHSIVVQNDNKILIGGIFTSYSGVTANRIIRLNTNGNIDNTFNSGTGFNTNVRSIAIQNDGKILVGGGFNSYSGVTANRIIRLNTNGGIDNTFSIGAGFNGASTYSIAIQNDGKILVGGDFTSYSGVTANYIIRLNTDGSIDNTFNSGTGFDTTVWSMAIQNDGKILIGGDFTSYSGVTANRIIRLNTDGSVDNTFSTGSGFNNSPLTIAIQNDGKILVGGNFLTYSGVTAINIIRLNTNGSIDNTFDTGTGFDSSQIPSIKIFNDGKILVGGGFITYNGETAQSIIKLNTDGSTSTIYLSMFNGGVIEYGDDYSANYTDRSLVDKEWVLNQISGFTTGGITGATNGIGTTGQNVCLGGSLTATETYLNLGTAAGSRRLTVGDGNYTTYLQVTKNADMSGYIETRAGNEGTGCVAGVYVGPTFIENCVYCGTGYRYLRYDCSGIRYTATPNTSLFGDNHLVTKKWVLDNVPITGATNGLGVCGKNVCLGGTLINNSCINLCSNTLSITNYARNFLIGLGLTWSFGIGQASSVLTYPDGRMNLAGQFQCYSGLSSSGMVQINYNGTIDTSFSVGSGFPINNWVSCTAFQPDGKLVAVGAFTQYSGVSRCRIVRLNTNGSIDYTLSPGGGSFNGAPDDVMIQTGDSKIIVVGGFTSYSGVTSPKIIRLNTNGSRDVTFNPGNGFNESGLGPSKAVLQSDGKIIVTGALNKYNEIARGHIVRICSNGSIDNTFTTGSGFNWYGSCVIQQSDGKYVVTGRFDTYSGITANYIVRLNSNGTYDPTFYSQGFTYTGSLGSYVTNGLAYQPYDGKILVSGGFTSYSGVSVSQIIRLNTDGSLDETFLATNKFDTEYINDIWVQPDKKIIVSGGFTSYDGRNYNGIMRLCCDGSADESIIDTTFDGYGVRMGNKSGTTVCFNYDCGDAMYKCTSWQYFGDPDTNGTWRYGVSGGSFIHQIRQTGVYVTKDTISP
ncbi:MAG: hypothetical protein WC333_00840 [Dehalococcoidia bacterium]|jgi:hypothetical protein